MGESDWVYTGTHYDKSNSFASQDISGDITDLAFDDIVNELHTATLWIDANDGFYMRDQRSGESGYPTKIDKQDRIRIISVDGSGGATTNYDQVFDVIKKTPIKSEGGTLLKLTLKSIGKHIEDIPFIGRGTFTNPGLMWEKLGNFYNDNKGSDQPLLDGHLRTDSENELPQGLLQHYDFGNNEEKILQRFRQISDQQGAAGAKGGQLDFHDWRVDSKTGNVTEMTISGFSSGSPSAGSEVTIDTSADVTINAGETDGGEEELRGNIVFSWGANDAGSLPTDYSRFKSRQILMPDPENAIFATFVSGETYENDSIVKLAGVVYQANTQTTATPPDADWDTLTTATYYGNVIQYSPWTDDKAALWKNSGGDPTDTTTSNHGAAMPDINIILNDDTTFGTWVDVKSTTDNFNVFWKYGSLSGGNYEGLRCLVAGTGINGFTGNDTEGRAFTNSIAEYSGGEWRVKYSAIDDMFCYVFDEAKNFQYDSGGASWANVTTLDDGSWNNHPYISIANGESVFTDENDSEYTTTNANSSIVATYEWVPAAAWAQEFFNVRTSADYFRAGGWLCLRFPYPKNTLNSIDENLGELYGGGADDWVTSTSYIINDRIQESGLTYQCEEAHSSGTFATDLTALKWVLVDGKAPTHMDMENMTFTHDGYRGFNFGLSSNDYGPINAVEFFMKIVYTDQSDVLIPKGNFKMRHWMPDASDHMAYQDYVISHNQNWQAVSLPLNGYQVYRGRRPRFQAAIVVNDLIVPRGLDANEQIEWRHIAMMGWQTQESYDDFGRYQGGRGDFGIANIATFTNRRLKIFIDAVRFRKPLLVGTPQNTVSPKFLMPFPEHQEIVVYDQLEAISFSELEKAQFERVTYDIETSIRHDIRAGEFFFLLDGEIVDKQDDSTDNKIKLVANHIEYFIRGDGEDGGATRLIHAGRRFV